MKSTFICLGMIWFATFSQVALSQESPETSSSPGTEASERQAASNALHIAAQKICPVSGQPLGSMGEPVKVQVGDNEHAFLCCNACTRGKIDAGYWQTVLDNLAAAQGTCPVMDQPVDSSMPFTTVKGRRIFVCCPPCIKKIEADPEKFIAELDARIAKNTAEINSPESAANPSGNDSNGTVDR